MLFLDNMDYNIFYFADVLNLEILCKLFKFLKVSFKKIKMVLRLFQVNEVSAMEIFGK